MVNSTPTVLNEELTQNASPLPILTCIDRTAEEHQVGVSVLTTTKNSVYAFFWDSGKEGKQYTVSVT